MSAESRPVTGEPSPDRPRRHPERPRWRDRTIGCAIFRDHDGCSRDDCHCPCHFIYADDLSVARG